MYNLLEHSDNYFMTSESLWKYYREKVNVVNDNAWDSKSFTYIINLKNKRKIEARSAQPENEEDSDQEAQPPVPTINVEFTISLKYLRNFWRSFHFF